jgi:hypothetical protein
MFGIHHFTTRARGLTLGLAAAALALTTLAVPVHAGLDDAGKLALADIVVTGKGVVPYNGGWKANFEVRNKSTHTVNVRVRYSARTYKVSNWTPLHTVNEYDAEMPFAPGFTRTIGVVCEPQAGGVCGSFNLGAAYSLDPKQSNNAATYVKNAVDGPWILLD